MKHECIYCGASTDLSESDIIPDALTSARILNKNVCRIAHNNKFSDLFESEVISALSFITNELDIKSHKAKRYAGYDATVTIEGESYNTSIHNDKEIFDGRVLVSSDKKHKFSSYERVMKMAKDPNDVKPIDINNIEIETDITINTSIYFSVPMFRLVSKIAYEWYCAKNNVTGYHSEFKEIVSYITTGIGNCPVSIIQTKELYQMLSQELNLGSHTLFAFESESGSIEVVVSLFGILMYRVVIATVKPAFCSKNFLFVELRTDASRKEVEHESSDTAYLHFLKLFNPDKYTPSIEINGSKLMIPKLSQTSNDIVLYMFLFNMMKCFNSIRNDTQEPTETVNQILFQQLQEIIQSSLLHKKSIKRFVNEYFGEGHELIKLNPASSNKKISMLLYAVFVVGKSSMKTLNDSKFQELMKKTFILNGNNEFIVTDELEKEFKATMLSTPEYSDILERGAEIIKKWT